MSPLAHWLADGARRHPAAPALLGPHGTWRYGELASLADEGGSFLRRQAVQPGDIVAIAGSASELALAALACAAASAALLPLDPLTADAVWPALQTLAGGRLQRFAPLRWPGDFSAGAAPPAPAGHAGEVALLIATSGSEGAPKVVQLTRGNLAAAAAASNQRLPLHAGDVWLACLPLHHIGGISILYRCLRAGASMRLHEGFAAAAVWDDLHRLRISHLSLVPAMLARLLDLTRGATPPASLRYVLVGGAALSPAMGKRALASGWPICPTWGMSESAAQAATLLQPGADWQAGQVGDLLPGLSARLAADGRLQLRGAQLMAGYLNPDWRRGDGLEDGWLSTSDLGTIDAAGRLTIIGRADDMLISAGVSVHPLEVESCLAACPGVADIAVTAIADPVWGDALVALFVGQVELQALQDWSRQHLISAKRPRRFVRVPQLPRNAIGKFERGSLRALAQAAA